MATILTGIASTPSLDAQRHSVLPGAFDLKRTPTLLWRHDAKACPCGTITRLSYRDDGCLVIRALIDDDWIADRAAGFSVAFGVVEYEIKNKGRADFYSAISKANLTEISLVRNPVNPECVVLTRERIPRIHDEFFGNAAAAFVKAREILQTIKRGIAA